MFNQGHFLLVLTGGTLQLKLSRTWYLILIIYSVQYITIDCYVGSLSLSIQMFANVHVTL